MEGKTEKEFELILDEFRKQLLEACIHFDIWEQLWPTEENVGIINRYKGFFIPTRNAHLDRFYIRTCNVLSNGPKSPSLYRILGMIDKNPNIAPTINTLETKNRLKRHKRVLKGIKQYRDTKAAHWDMNTQYSQISVLLGDSRRMLKELQDIFNEIYKSYTKNQQWSFKPLEHDDASRLLQTLRTKKN